MINSTESTPLIYCSVDDFTLSDLASSRDQQVPAWPSRLRQWRKVHHHFPITEFQRLLINATSEYQQWWEIHVTSYHARSNSTYGLEFSGFHISSFCSAATAWTSKPRQHWRAIPFSLASMYGWMGFRPMNRMLHNSNEKMCDFELLLISSTNQTWQLNWRTHGPLCASYR